MLTIRQFTFNPVEENTYVVFTEEKECFIIDPGCYFEYERKELTDFIEKNELAPKCLLNTHAHPDHIFGNQFIAERYALSVHMHQLETPVLKAAPALSAGWGMPFDNYTGQPIYLETGSDLVLGTWSFRVLFTPGHSPGSVCFYCESEKMLIAGDVLFRQGIGRTDLPGGDYPTIIGSIREQLFTLPDEVTVYPGHGPHTSIGFEKQHNPFLQ